MFIHRYHGHGIVDDATSEAHRDIIACSKWRKTAHKPNFNAVGGPTAFRSALEWPRGPLTMETLGPISH